MVSKNLSVCLWSTFTPIISGLAEQNGLKKIQKIFGKMDDLKNFICQESGWQGRGRGPKQQYILNTKMATQTCTISRGYEICNTKFTYTELIIMIKLQSNLTILLSQHFTSKSLVASITYSVKYASLTFHLNITPPIFNF